MKLILPLMLMFFVGCSLLPKKPTSYYVYVDSISPEEAPGLKKFAIVSGLDGINYRDSTFAEFAAITSKAFEQRGFVPVSLDQAELVVKLSYNLSKDVYTSSKSVPVYGNAFGTNYNVHNNWGNKVGSVRVQNLQPTAYKQQVTQHVDFMRKVKIQVFKKDKLIWAVGAKSVGASGDLRKVFPYLIVAAESYFDTSVSAQELHIFENDHRVKNLRAPASH